MQDDLVSYLYWQIPCTNRYRGRLKKQQVDTEESHSESNASAYCISYSHHIY